MNKNLITYLKNIWLRRIVFSLPILLITGCSIIGNSEIKKNFLDAKFEEFVTGRVNDSRIIDIDEFISTNDISMDDFYKNILFEFIDNYKVITKSQLENTVIVKFQNFCQPVYGDIATYTFNSLARTLIIQYLSSHLFDLALVNTQDFCYICSRLYEVNTISCNQEKIEKIIQFMISENVLDFVVASLYLLDKKIYFDRYYDIATVISTKLFESWEFDDKIFFRPKTILEGTKYFVLSYNRKDGFLSCEITSVY